MNSDALPPTPRGVWAVQIRGREWLGRGSLVTWYLPVDWAGRGKVVHSLGGRGERGLRVPGQLYEFRLKKKKKKSGGGGREIAQGVKAPAAEPVNLSISGPIWWKAGTYS